MLSKITDGTTYTPTHELLENGIFQSAEKETDELKQNSSQF